MKQVKSSGRFRKDLKRYLHKPKKLDKLYWIIGLLEMGEPIPREYEPHYLTGVYAGHLECHIENDFLLIWIDETENVIKLIRLGTHSELFGK